MDARKNVVLITGGFGGIGLELGAQLMADPSTHVILAGRSIPKGEAALKRLEPRSLSGTVELLQLDVSSQESITAAAKIVEAKHGRLDALVNNAAIGTPDVPLDQLMAQSFQTNATGPMLMVEAFAPLLEKSTRTPRIINVTSGAGSIETRLDSASPFYTLKANHYRASKTALNMITACQAVEYGEKGFKVFAFCPGFTVSELGPANKAENGAKPTSEGAAPMVNILKGERDAEHGRVLKDGGQWSW